MTEKELNDLMKRQKINHIKYKIHRFFTWPIRATKSTILCIRFPFLYPRNRWTDRHYTNWKLWDYRKGKWNDAYEWNSLKTDKNYSNIPGCWEVKNKYLAFKIKCADLLNDFLSFFHCIPTYTELDAMPKGWRKCFGIQMCKEIKKALLEDGRKTLKQYRIDQIKEKFGDLRWYDTGGNRQTEKVIAKYGYISYRTCIECGRPAEYVTNGWIEPYCERCIPENKKDKALKYESDMDFYGWTNQEYYEKHKKKQKETEDN